MRLAMIRTIDSIDFNMRPPLSLVERAREEHIIFLCFCQCISGFYTKNRVGPRNGPPGITPQQSDVDQASGGLER